MVVEFLTFRVEPAERDEWLEVEARTWSRFLEQQPGFVRKEIWLSADDPTAVHAVIHWRDRESWKAIPDSELAAVDAEMGHWVRQPVERVFHVLRDR